MKTYGIIGIAVLLLAGTVQAVNTVSALTGNGLLQTQPGQIGPEGPWNEGVAYEQGYALQILYESDGLFPSEPDICCDLRTIELGRSATCPAELVEDAVGDLATGPVDGLDPNAGWRTDHHWSTIPRTFSEVGSVGADGGIVLPAFDESRWVLTPPPATRESFIMEFVVFPFLGAMMLVLATRLLMLRVRTRRSRSQAQQLLQV